MFYFSQDEMWHDVIVEYVFFFTFFFLSLSFLRRAILFLHIPP